LPNPVTSTAERFATALDNEDYRAVSSLIEDDCEYVTPKGELVGPDAIVASYQEAAAWAKAHIDAVRYTSAVRSDGDDAVIKFSDHLEHHGARHTYTCEQVLRVNHNGRVTRIVHQELPGERESLNSFLRGIGISRQ
jgi:ketosteroid isomerase-like protein